MILNLAFVSGATVAISGYLEIVISGLIDSVALSEFRGSLIAFPVDLAVPAVIGACPYAEGT